MAVAAEWREVTPRPVSEVLAVPELAHYIDGWPAAGDFGVVAERTLRLGQLGGVPAQRKVADPRDFDHEFETGCRTMGTPRKLLTGRLDANRG